MPINDPHPPTNTRQRRFVPEMEIDGPGSQNRLTVAFRAILAIPQYLALAILAIAQWFVLLASWFAAVFTGRAPTWAHEFLAGYLGYVIRVYAYVFLLVDRYPPFSLDAPDYPVRIELRRTRLNRAAVLFRTLLSIPASFIATLVYYGWSVCAFFLWLAVLSTGRTPTPVFGASAAVLRYMFRLQAYFMLLTDAYPQRLFGDATTPSNDGQRPQSSCGPERDDPATDDQQKTAGAYSGTRPLVLTRGARTLLVVFLMTGAAYLVTTTALQVQLQKQQQQLHDTQFASAISPIHTR